MKVCTCSKEFEELVFNPFKNTPYDYSKCAECNLAIIFKKETSEDN